MRGLALVLALPTAWLIIAIVMHPARLWRPGLAVGTILGQWTRGYGRGAPTGPAGNTWTDRACSTIPLCSTSGFPVPFEGQLEKVGELIMDGADVDEQDQDGYFALMAATIHGHAAVAEVLVKAGARVDLQDKIGGTALMAAVQNGHAAIAEMLVKAWTQTVAREKKIEKKRKKRRVIQYVPPADL